MYTATLILHSWLRWIVIVLGLLAVARAMRGRSSGRAWIAAEAVPGRLYGRALDVQMLLGLLLYFVFSHILTIAREDMGHAMSTPTIRFWLVEHLAGMVAAIALAHVGTARVRKAASDTTRFGQAALFYGLSLIAILLATPWPGLPHARPLFRLW